jgi:hypothetical protein
VASEASPGVVAYMQRTSLWVGASMGGDKGVQKVVAQTSETSLGVVALWIRKRAIGVGVSMGGDKEV